MNTNKVLKQKYLRQ